MWLVEGLRGGDGCPRLQLLRHAELVAGHEDSALVHTVAKMIKLHARKSAELAATQRSTPGDESCNKVGASFPNREETRAGPLIATGEEWAFKTFAYLIGCQVCSNFTVKSPANIKYQPRNLQYRHVCERVCSGFLHICCTMMHESAASGIGGIRFRDVEVCIGSRMVETIQREGTLRSPHKVQW